MKLQTIKFLGLCMTMLLFSCGSNHGTGNNCQQGPVAPNSALITANVLEITSNSPVAGQTLLRLYISRSDNIGTEINMAAANTEIQATTYDQFSNIYVNDTITAVATLGGDECGTAWGVSNIQKVQNPI